MLLCDPSCHLSELISLLSRGFYISQRRGWVYNEAGVELQWLIARIRMKGVLDRVIGIRVIYLENDRAVREIENRKLHVVVVVKIGDARQRGELEAVKT